MDHSFAASAEQLVARLDAAHAAAVLQAECNQKLDTCLNEKGEAQKAVEELRRQLDEKGVELQKVVGERDARAKEKGEAQKAVEELRKQLEQVSASLTDKETEAKAASEEVELTLLHLHRVQEELEALFVAKQHEENELKKFKQQFQQVSDMLEESLVFQERAIRLQFNGLSVKGQKLLSPAGSLSRD